jgi:hypothetical protein
VIDPKDPNFGKGWYYFSIHSFKQEGSFKCTVRHVEPRADSEFEEKKGNLALNRDESKVVDKTKHTKCDNCHKYVPNQSFTMHSVTCQRNNWFCKDCGKVIPRKEKDSHGHCEICHLAMDKSELEKHVEFVHGNVNCECGESVPRSDLDVHKAEYCIRRVVPCRYCGTQVPFIQKENHQSTCGARSISCEICGSEVPRKREATFFWMLCVNCLH